MKILMAINTLTALDNFVYSNHAQFYYEMGKRFGSIEGNDLLLFHPYRMSIDRMRNEAAKIAMGTGCDYLFFVDDDVQIPWDAAIKLTEAGKDVIAGITYVRGYPFRPMVFNWECKDTDSHWTKFRDFAPEDQILQCDAVGFSCCMIKVDLLHKLTKPYFLTGAHHTEDIYFCHKVKDEHPESKIYVHCGVETAHKLGSEFVEVGNLKPLIKYMEATGSGTPIKKFDRTEEYLEQNAINKEELENA